ncbi:peptidase S41 [Defluviimonas sp. SAOS-178_SWC]|uniref:peptidase S41 n=1 Tax=Defluviimonas sp. SAOS-178_SWC TaxID=3121287 RepID=UPI00322211DA
MSFHMDAELIEDIVLRRDQAFRDIGPDMVRDRLGALRDAARKGNLDLFLLAAMRLLALPRNGHTRLIPNAAIAVHPLRFVAIGAGIYLTTAPAGLSGFLDMRLVAVNGRPVDAFLAGAEPMLAGNAQRRRVIGALLLVWPAALGELTGCGPDAGARYDFRDSEGGIVELRVARDRTVPAMDLYPVSEKGGLEPAIRRPHGFATADEIGHRAIRVSLRDFYDPEGGALEAGLARVAQAVIAAPDRNLVFDLRGNPGGDFLKTVPFLRTVREAWRGERCAVLVDKFTFSAAIVCAALLKDMFGAALSIVGEGMGDDLRFFAEGGTVDLAESRAAMRYSTAFHDWETGVAVSSTPEEIARHLVAAGDLRPDPAVDITAADLRQGRDPQLAAAVKAIS